MLAELKIKNLGIIEDVTWQLKEGLNVITGETGAGKSLLLDAVELLLSGKADEDVIRYGADEARIEAVFQLPPLPALSLLRDLLEQKDLGGDEDTLIISCQLRRKGTAVVRVNGHAVLKGVLHQIGRLLIDVHSQSEHYVLLDSDTHLDFLDAYAGTAELRNACGKKAAELRELEEEIKKLEADEKDRVTREEFLRFQLDELNRAKLREGEEEELDRERRILAAAERLKELSYNVYSLLNGEDSSSRTVPVVDKINEAVQAMKKLVELDASLNQQLAYLEETAAGLTEAAREIHAYSGRLQHDPARLAEIESRLELIDGLKRKYGKTIAEMLAYLAKTESELEAVRQSDERRSHLKDAAVKLKQEMGNIAAQLSQQRIMASRQLTADMLNELKDLNMEQVKFEVSVRQQIDAVGMPFPDGKHYICDSTGADTVEFLASTNPGEPLKPLVAIASTGELSRFTLALKSALSAADEIPVLIFDEVDIGIGGRSGEIIGKKLWLLSRNHQVVCVTHLPQIAAFADAHFGVHKVASGERTLSVMEIFDADSRLKELAVMLAGLQYSKTALKNAGELIRGAEGWKRNEKITRYYNQETNPKK